MLQENIKTYFLPLVSGNTPSHYQNLVNFMNKRLNPLMLGGNKNVT